MAEISENELNERVRVLRRFRSLLEMQRKKFREYLEILEKQQDSISAENAEIVASHAELERQVVEGIGNLQKVIVPMAKLYNDGANGGAADAEEDKRVLEIQSDLNRLQEQVLAQNQKNRALLKSYLVHLREQIDNFQNPYAGRQSVYAANGASGSLVALDA
ncbi:MAG: flagellar export chaperone FlgN [Treponema sp.]